MSENTVPVQFNKSATLLLSDENKSALINMAILDIVTKLSNSYYYCESGEYNWLINENNFDAIWNDYSDSRQGLVTTLINCLSRNSYYSKSAAFSNEFSKGKLHLLNDQLMNHDDINSDSIRRAIVPSLYSEFDYKSEILRLIELSRDQTVVNAWIDLASNHSKDESLFEFLLSNIKRGEGATELKVNILNKAFRNEVICETFIKKIAASAPISLRRTVVSGLTNLSRDFQSRLRYGGYENEDLNLIREKCDKIENLAMMFVSLNDRSILRDLSTSLSIKNLPWILPAAANYPWIVKDIQRRIDREGV